MARLCKPRRRSGKQWPSFVDRALRRRAYAAASSVGRSTTWTSESDCDRVADLTALVEFMTTQQNKLREDHETLCACLRASGLLTQRDLTEQCHLRWRASRVKEFCQTPALVKALADCAGHEAMCQFSMASSAASSGFRSILLMASAYLDNAEASLATTMDIDLLSIGKESVIQGEDSDSFLSKEADSIVELSIDKPEPESGIKLADLPSSVALPRRGLTARFLGRLFSWRREDAEGEFTATEEMVMALPEIIRSIGRSAGGATGRRLCATSKGVAQMLRPLVPELTRDSHCIYICGGSCGVASNSVECFHPLTGVWEDLPPMCMPRRACAAASADGRLYVMGGVDLPHFAAGSQHEERYRPECYDPASNKWHLLPPMGRPHTHAAAAAAGGYIYVFGGLSFGNVLDQAQRFDPLKEIWESLEPMPTPRFECAAATLKGEICILGGANVCGEPLSVAESYAPSTGRWRALPRMSQSRYGCAAVAVEGRIYVIGGHGFWENLGEAECFDPVVGAWSPLPPMMAARNRCGAAASNGKIYIFGGNSNGQDALTVECFNLGDSSWEIEGEGNLRNLADTSWEIAGWMRQARGHCMTVKVCT